jgi:acetyl-CoA synthetase
MRASETETPTFIWRPDSARVANANVTRLMRRLEVETASELRRFSVERTAQFWDAVIEDCGIHFDQLYEQTVDLSRGHEWSRWFLGGKINLARVCMDLPAEREPDKPAVSWDSERGEQRELTWAELRSSADAIARALQDLGVEAGDTVGLFMPMTPEALAAYYACAKLGAVSVPIFSGLGAEAVGGRLEDAGTRVVVTADGYPRAGRVVELKTVIDQACEVARGVQHVLVLRRLGIDVRWKQGRDVAWEDAVRDGSPLESLPLDSSHPLQLMYTSGTAGRPKGALHTHSGFLAIAARDATYGLDLGERDTLCWPTDLGWIMGPWTIVAAGTTGVHICLSEGSPLTPADRLWQAVERYGVTVQGVGPTLVRAMMAADQGEALRSRHQLGTLRELATAGEPMPADAYEWLFQEVGGRRCPIVNLSGGTEVGGCFLIPLPIEGLKTSSLGGPALGMDVAVFGEDGSELGPGEVGELVCRSVWPGMTQGLWNDDERFLETYWSRFPGVWTHGDWASYDEDGQWFLHGRSDDTLNVAGQRIGPAEIEGVLLQQRGIADAAAVAMPHPVKGEAIWCFVVSTEERPDGDALATAVAGVLGKPFRPERVVFCSSLPRTRSAKLVRRSIRAAALGEELGDLSSLENPAALEQIREAVA